MKLSALFFIVAFCLLGQTAMAQTGDDVVYLKDGSVIKGTIIEQVPNATIKIQTKDGSIFVIKYDEIEKIVKEQGISEPQKTGGNPKNPGVAFVLSWLVPGSGQVYNNQPAKGIIQFGTCLAGYVVFLNQLPWTEEVHYWDQDLGAWLWKDEEKGNGALAWSAFAVALGCHVWSMIDAPTTASRYNRDHGFSFNEIPLRDNLALSFAQIDSKHLTIKPQLKLQYRF
jgi:hypothetical protein